MEKRRTVVVVDDEPITRIDLSQLLTELGFGVVGSAADGFDAVELCRALHPDVVLMDIKMPVFDGLTASETIIQQGLAGCVVLLTAFSDKEFIERAAQAGIGGYLVKPVEERLLLPTLEMAIAQARSLKLAQRETQDIKRQMQETRQLERAKAVFAREKGISEAQAYRELQQLSMNKRRPLAEIAQAVLCQSSEREVVNEAKELLIRKQGISEPAAYKQLVKLAEQKNISLETVARQLLAHGPGRGNIDTTAVM